MKYNQLTYIAEAGQNKHGKRLWRLLCDCGNECVKIASAVRIGQTKSCGCRKKAGNGNKKHGRSGTKEYAAWLNMRNRCSNKNYVSFKSYGGRGIGVHPSWSDFETFLRDVGPCPSKSHSLDRINNEIGYQPGNVRWATAQQQSENKRVNILLSINGETKCFCVWCREYGISPASVYQRMSRGEDVVSAITRPKAERFKKITI